MKHLWSGLLIVAAAGSLAAAGYALAIGYGPGSDGFDRASGDLLNDSDLFTRAMEKSDFVRIPHGSYALTEPIVVLDGKTLVFEDVTLVAIGGPAIVANNAKGWALRGELSIEGMEGVQNGVVISDPINATIENLSVSGALGSAISISGERQALPRGNTLGIGRLYLEGNAVGIELAAGAGAEFVTIQNLEARANGIAAIIGAGNTRILGGNIVDNFNGILFTGGHNHGHGILSGTTVAHSAGYNLRFDGVTNGFVVLGNAIYGDTDDAGLIEIERSDGIVISNGILAARVVETDPVGAAVICKNFSQPPADPSADC